ncbi:hypothetical protein F383_02613 [Gossypium arboreum]|uniref:Uncharacterized protein n=1 Tax=Gossypium arboreum TaxID=29729 RepID=A0A0B0PMI6_GOSAR|nr:hypothetical protein F383_02613 [Gossypium arboreum]
MHNHYNFGC